MKPNPEYLVSTLGTCTIDSPLAGPQSVFVDENRVLTFSDTGSLSSLGRNDQIPSMEKAGAHKTIFFDPESIRCGIVTCGGLCPGINDVIRSLVLTLHHAYGVRSILGFRYGYLGLTAAAPAPPLELTPEAVSRLHHEPGTVLGSSRGPQDIAEMVDHLVKYGISILFVIGGDGTLRGAHALHQEISRQRRNIAVVGIPKTIDNDLSYVSLTFGFHTAVEEATRAIQAAHAEAVGAWNGIGLVKLMGRHSGFIAANATLTNSDVNFCLVPEVPFSLDGENGLFKLLERRLARKPHAVVVVAEGAGQDLMQEDAPQFDASGNIRLNDIGTFLRDRITGHFRSISNPVTVKYIDPSYTLRGGPANALDSELCLALGQLAVHAGMAGRTGVMVGMWNMANILVPIPVAVQKRKQLDPHGRLWHGVLTATGQPFTMA